MRGKLFLFIILGIFLTSNLLAVMPEPTIWNNLQLQKTILSQESDYNGDGIPDVYTEVIQINSTLIEIYVNQTNNDGKGGNAYKWQSALFNLTPITSIQKLEYNPATDVWSNTGNLNTFDYQWTTGWNHEGNTKGYSLFGSGSGEKRYRLIIPEGMEFKIFTGKNSEEILYEWINNTYFVYPTDTYEKQSFEVTIYDENMNQFQRPDISYIEPFTNTEKEIDFYPNITNIVYPLSQVTFRVNTLEIPIYEKETIFQTEKTSWKLEFKKFEAKNNITNKTIEPVYHSVLECLSFANIIHWEDFVSCRDNPYAYDITYYGNIIDLDPTISYTSVTSSNTIVENITSELEFSHITVNDSSLVSYWSFDVNARDLTNNNNDGTLVGNAFVNSSGGKYGGGLQLDGNGDYVNLDSSLNSFRSDSQGTICVWANYFSGNTNWFFSTSDEGSGNYLTWFRYGTTGLRWFVKSTSTILDLETTSGVNMTGWRFNCVKANSTGTFIYQDGDLKRSSATRAWMNDSDNVAKDSMSLGGSQSIAGYSANGSLDEVMYFNRALTDGEIQQIYNSTYSRFYPEGNQTFKAQNITAGYNRVNLTVEAEALNGSSLNATIWEADVNYDYGDVANYLPYNSSGYLELDGSGDYVDVGNIFPSSSINFTISTWAYHETGSRYLWSQWRTGTGEGLLIQNDGSNNLDLFLDASSLISVSGFWADNNNKWVFLTVKFNGTEYSLYNNNTLIGTATASYPDFSDTGAKFVIGNRHDLSREWQGRIDEVLIFNTSLSEAEIQNIYNLNRTQKYNGSTDNLVSYYSFNTGSAQDDFGSNDGKSTGDAYIPNVLDADNSLVGYWHGDGNANDYSGNGNDGTFAGNANANGIGVFNNSFSFDGSGDYVSVGTLDSSVYGSNPRTISFWAKSAILDYTQDGYAFNLNSLNIGSNQLFGIRVEDSTDEWWFTDGATARDTNIGVSQDWQHIVITLNSSKYLNIFINGEITSVSDVLLSSINTQTGNALIGEQFGTSRNFNGQIDEVMIFNRSLSADEIKSLYVTGSLDHRNDGVGVNWTSTEGSKTLGVFNSTHLQYPNYTIQTDSNYLIPELNLIGGDYSFYSPTPFNLELETFTPIPSDTTPPNISVYNITEEEGVNINADFNATDDSGIDYWWINDTSNFAIDQTGQFTNATVLGVAVYSVNVSVNDTYGNIASEVIVVNITEAVDITPPKFTEPVPQNDTITYSDNWTGVNFNATDETGIDIYWVNDSRFIINSTGYLDDNELIGFGNWTINVSVNDTSGNINSTVFLLIVNQANAGCKILFNETSPITYPSTFLVWQNCSTDSTLYRNGTIISNNSIQELGAGSYNFTVITDDIINYTNYQDTEIFNINKKASTCEVVDGSVTYPTPVSISGSCNNPEASSQFFIDDDLISSPFEEILGASTYTFKVNVSETQNYTSATDSKIVTVTQGSPSLYMTINNNNSNDWSYSMPINLLISGNETAIGDGDLTYNIFLDSVSKTNPFENFFTSYGTYTITYNTTGGQNWTIGSKSQNLVLSEAGTTTVSTPVCRYKKYGYYNLNLPWFRQEGCI